ncbi:hypothetical protein FBU59_003292 [Linderina macrospora]|uniref:Uncharacterized protein n=1 Tax=Linderina macrospora TaxID=4868 RepID=A0ACC1J8Q7_9FUNG|nr:hypothetical protein FBU59_003292 [Linderina macrospora]
MASLPVQQKSPKQPPPTLRVSTAPLAARHLSMRRPAPLKLARNSSLNLHIPSLKISNDEPQTPLTATAVSQPPVPLLPLTPLSISPRSEKKPAAKAKPAMSLSLSSKPRLDDNLDDSGDTAMARRAAMVYSDGPRQIVDRLFLGGEGNCDGEQLKELQIGHVLNVAREVTGPMQSGSCVEMDGHLVAYRHYRWDHDEPDLQRYFDECFAFIDAARNRNQSVLVHCQLGVSRSASLVIAYVMRTLGMGFSAAYEYVQNRAPCISPNLSLIAQLCEYGKMLDGKTPGVETPVTATTNSQPELVVMTSDMVVSPGLPGLTHSASSSEYSSPVEEEMAVATHPGLSALGNMPSLSLLALKPAATPSSHDTRSEPAIVEPPFH